MSLNSSVKKVGDRRYKKVLMIGMDGLDHKVLSALMQSGDLPNFTRLAETGGYTSLATSNPAQSPVAWATIATGRNPGYHGIYDFLNRRISDYMPVLAILKQNPKNIFAKREAMFLSILHGDTFWDLTQAAGIPSTVLKWPMTFQPKQNDAKLFCGLGVPDIKGGLGRYAFYSTRDVPKTEEGHEKVIKINVSGGKAKTHVAGPNISKLLSRDEAKLDMLITVKQDNTGVELEIDGYKALLAIGQWSEWIALSFKMGRNKFTTGNVKFCLSSIAPDLEFYMTPVQISPKDPAFVISSPDDYVKELAAQQGDFYTLGMPEDTKALEEKRIDEEAFIAMCDEIVDEQEKMMWFEMDRFEEGLLASTFFSTDRIQHMFWETKDRDHPLYSEEYERKYGHVIDDYYKKMDRILGDVMQKVDDQTALLVFSDHGFSTFRRTVHINTWLVQQGYMQLTQKVEAGDSEGGTLFQYVDWKNTQAYAVGFGSIYLNIKGREKTGIVEPGAAADALADKIVREMNQMKDPANGVVAIKKVYKNSDIYSGNLISESPDLVVGFEDGYRASWQTAIGGAPYELMEDNLKKWSGDHIVDPSVVPGILLSNHKIKIDDPGLMDIAPTVLSCFGMQDESMQGRVLI